MKKIMYWLTGVLLLLLAAWVVTALVINRVKEPAFTTLARAGAITVRQYQPYIVAKVDVSGERRAAASQGFRLIADYIFGNNRSRQQDGKEKIAMTAPVIQESFGDSKKIAMTAPVIQESMMGGASMADKGDWTVQFVMPQEYTLQTLPQPNNPAVKLVSVPAKKWLVIRYSGSWNTAAMNKQWGYLQDYIKNNNIKTAGAPRTAFYNAPFTPPFLRRNEIMIEIR